MSNSTYRLQQPEIDAINAALRESGNEELGNVVPLNDVRFDWPYFRTSSKAERSVAKWLVDEIRFRIAHMPSPEEDAGRRIVAYSQHLKTLVAILHGVSTDR